MRSSHKTYTLNCRGKLLVIDQPVVMGIINATPDSFYSGSRHMHVDAALKKAGQMLAEGAAILDIGGQSTRPGAAILGPAEEQLRVLPVIDAILAQYPEAILSIDTYHSETALKAVEHGARIVNDISGGNFDPQMIGTVASLCVPYVCMHVKGDATNMHRDPSYENVVQEVLDYFISKISDCRAMGIHDIILDPGFGFSKNITHNFSLLRHLEVFGMFDLPLLLGLSRKSTIYKTLGIPVEESLNGTSVLNTAGLLKGASILRVHDVKEAVEAVKLTGFLQ